MQVGIAAKESRTETIVHAQHILYHQHLSVYLRACTDTYYGDTQFARHTCSQRSRNLFEHQGKASGIFQQMAHHVSVFQLLVVLGPYRIRAVFIDRLRHQSQVSHNGDTGAQYTLHGTDYLFARLSSFKASA